MSPVYLCTSNRSLPLCNRFSSRRAGALRKPRFCHPILNRLSVYSCTPTCAVSTRVVQANASRLTSDPQIICALFKCWTTVCLLHPLSFKTVHPRLCRRVGGHALSAHTRSDLLPVATCTPLGLLSHCLAGHPNPIPACAYFYPTRRVYRSVPLCVFSVPTCSSISPLNLPLSVSRLICCAPKCALHI